KQVVGNWPEVGLGDHPMDPIEAAQVDGTRNAAQRLFAPKVVVVLEIRHSQLAQRAIDGFAKAQAGVVGFGDRPPAAALAKKRQHMVVIANRFEIEQEWLESLNSQGCGAEQSALEALRHTIAQDAARAAAGRASQFLVVTHAVIEKALDLQRGSQPAERLHFTAVESVCQCFSSQNTLFYSQNRFVTALQPCPPTVACL